MKYCTELLVALWFFLNAGVLCIPLRQFLQFGEVAGDERTTFNGGNDDGTSRLITLSPSYPISGRQRTSLYINVNGVVSVEGGFSDYTPKPFPHTNGVVILCPFWDDVRIDHAGTIYNNNGTSDSLTNFRVSQLIHESLGISFSPTGVFVVTWDHVSYHDADSQAQFLGKNTFQCVLVTNGQDTFVLFLYADGLIQWARGFSGGDYAQVGVDGGDGVNYYSIPNSLTPEIINIAHTSNVNTPGLWILKVDNNIIAAAPSLPLNLLVQEITATEATLSWKDSGNNSDAESFTINCTGTTELTPDIHRVVAHVRPLTYYYGNLSNPTGINNTFNYSIAGLKEYTNYTCTIIPRNAFGQGPTSESIVFTTNSSAPSSPPNHIMCSSVSVSTFHLEWSPPSVEDRNGIITGYRILLDWDMGQELRATTTHTNYTFTGLQQDTDYYYRIAAETSAGLGPFSNRTLVCTLPESSTNANINNTETTREAYDTDTAATSGTERKGLNFGVISGAGGAGVLLLMFTAVTIIAVLCVRKRKNKCNTKSMDKGATNQKPHFELKETNHYDNTPMTSARPYEKSPHLQQASREKRNP